MNANPVHITFEHIGKSLGRGEGRRRILDDITLEVRQGEFLTFFGPNGCGKTTLLNMLTGLESVDDGVLTINSMNRENEKPRVGYIFQDYRGNLMPWLTVAQNIAFPLKIRGISKSECVRKVAALCARFGFTVDLNARTYTLSGGEAQLTSILRALVIEPDILLMDEPFSALDFQTNLSLYDKVLRIWETTKVTILLVSHDLDEALYLGERTVFLTKSPATIVAVLENTVPGKKSIAQMGTKEFAVLKAKALKIFGRTIFPPDNHLSPVADKRVATIQPKESYIA
jgi:NitT/TauT family transport system ATP-binding protein